MKMIRKQTIDKYEPTQEILLPYVFKIISIGNQHEKIMFWYECETPKELGASLRPVKFFIVDTGDEVPENCEFVGTVLLHGGIYVRHVYVSKN